MRKTYFEIVHVAPRELECWRDQGSSYAQVSRRILELDQRTVHYMPGELDENLPNIPNDTPIRVGGAFWDICVRIRSEILKRRGFTNVQRVRNLSFG